MKTETNEHLVDWLRDAHAMENQMETLLKGQFERIEHYVELKAAIQAHLEATRSHQVSVRNSIERLGGDTSAIKDLGAKIMATGQNLVGTAMSDEVIKGAMTLYIFTHVAISSYSVLSSAADFYGDADVKHICEAALDDEIGMSKWLEKELPQLTQAFLTRTITSSDSASR
ncbi:hypothetical protein GCM10011613_03740 [Cellvibrio zantedeschiae]|uniref:Ferritin-like domain-containing protein n=1 Tax=Cellvibrio zantedeschiae TaxID=1237077 RepID=A0ABQ3AQB8_9GAMM|nr:ferritin-like domain-containing protein [Cellvibrio zantedeschiae]GGY63303.1 hypothetical protein GCM10011613_03740 [Cellvibrio zantedeschiae]